MDIFTIGHSNHTIDKFISLLRINKINCIVDVRSTPYSKFTPQFNKDDLKKVLNLNSIIYIHMGKEFGARRNNMELYTKDGYLDFEKTRKDGAFLNGVDRVTQGYNKGFNIALMCTEKDPFDCHRCIMVGKGLKDHGFEVKHILPNNSIINQNQIEQRLLNTYYKNRNQITFETLMSNNLTEQEMIEASYKKRNKEIGYQIKGDIMYEN